MKRTLEVLNHLVDSRLIEKYAIGGAMGATFYTEPFTTFDLDVFVAFPETSGPLINLSPIYTELRSKGYTETVDECIMIEGIPVQFLPASTNLLDEALQKAKVIDYDGVSSMVLGAEYLLAISVETGRPKDKARVPLFMSSGCIDKNSLVDILKRHNLLERWDSWTKIQ